MIQSVPLSIKCNSQSPADVRVMSAGPSRFTSIVRSEFVSRSNLSKKEILMPDLRDGETVEVWGSGSKPYQLKNVNGVYSCSCPAWRNQSLLINQRSCKHLKAMRGEEAEAARLGTSLTTNHRNTTKPAVIAPQLLLAETWNEEIDPSGYWLSEKLDGVRAYWDGTGFFSRNGNPFAAPEWFTRGLPNTPLDGELWIGRKQFQRTVSIVRRSDAAELWNDVRFLIFDAPTLAQPFEQRFQAVMELIHGNLPFYAHVLCQTVCKGREHLEDVLARIEALGGEGVMLRRPGSKYVPRRSDTLLKVKSFFDCDATVVGHEPGKGRHKGRLGALEVELANGTRCAVGTGLTDAQRDRPPSIGTAIRLKYQELTDGGVPRFPVFAGVRSDISLTASSSSMKGNTSMSTTTVTTTSPKRRFEFVQGTSNKFWEISVQGTDVSVVYGRIGTAGQTNSKQFPTTNDAVKYAEKLIREKTAKGYVAAV
jgi:DNA ligase-1